MAKNILLLFLSDVKVSNGVVKPANYKDIGETYTTNESAVRYLSQIQKAPPSKIFYFSSNKVKEFIKKDRNSNEDFTENGETFTHISYFEKRIINYVDGKIKDVMQPCDFNENADIQQTMEVVIKMASMIQEYIVTLPKDTEVTLHVDMTGGMRHASLMMLVITRLIQYSGVKIGYILYSNFVSVRVEESNGIYNLFDIIAGAEEFVRFGSVDAILNYFANVNRNIPPVLQNLLDAMKNFADVIIISRRREFQNALEGLKTAYNNFSTVKNIKSLDYNLMQQLKVRIAKEYSTLLTCDADDYISIVGWCLEHGYIQQSLVLYTESFPYMMIVKDKIITLNSTYDEELADYTSEDGMNREKEYLLFNEFSPKGYSNNHIFLDYDDFIKKIKAAIQDIRCNRFDMKTFKKDNSWGYWKGRFIIQSDYDTYFELLEELQKLKADSNLVKDIETVAEKLPTLYTFWDLIPEDIFKIKHSNGRVKNILLSLEKNQKSARKDFIRKSNKVLTFHHMIEKGIFKLNIDEEKFFKIIDRYFIIKSERNDSVHARQVPKELLVSENSGKSYAALLKDYMQKGLEEYSDVVKP